MKLHSILLLLLLPSLALVSGSAIEARQNPRVLLTRAPSGTGCPPGNFSTFFGAGNQSVAINFFRFNASVTSGGSASLRCNIRFDMIPGSLLVVEHRCAPRHLRQAPLGRLGRRQSDLFDREPRCADSKQPIRMSGPDFVDGESVTDDDGIAIVARVPATRNLVFTIDVGNTANSSSPPRAGFSNLQVITYTINRTIGCSDL